MGHSFMSAAVAAAGILLAGFTAGCSSEQHQPAPRQFADPAFYVDEAMELQVAQLPGLVSWHRDVLVSCPELPPDATIDPHARYDACEVKVIGADRVIRSLGIQHVRAARRLAGDRLLILRPNLNLFVRTAAGDEEQVASAAMSPSVAPDGERIAFVQLPEGTTEPGLGLPTKLVFYDIVTGEHRIITEDGSAYAPYIIPRTSDVIYASGRTGLASFWIAPANETGFQLTNSGMTQPGKGFVPVPLQQLVWLPGTSTAVFTAHYHEDKLWMIDAGKGTAELLGPGRWPNLEKGDTILGFYDGPPGDIKREPKVVRYLEAP